MVGWDGHDRGQVEGRGGGGGGTGGVSRLKKVRAPVLFPHGGRRRMDKAGGGGVEGKIFPME